MTRIAKCCVGLLLLQTLGCGRIEGTAIEGSGGYARAAANLEVQVVRDPKAYHERCMLMLAMRDSIAKARSRFADSILKANATKPAESRVPRRTVLANIEMGAYGDGAKAVIERSAANYAALHRTVIWTGETDLQGRFKTKRLPAGDYLVDVDGTSRVVSVGYSTEKVQITYSRAFRSFNCLSGFTRDDDY